MEQNDWSPEYNFDRQALLAKRETWVNPWEVESVSSDEEIFQRNQWWTQRRRYILSYRHCCYRVIFYTLFYSSLGVLFMICWCIFYFGLLKHQPYYSDILTDTTAISFVPRGFRKIEFSMVENKEVTDMLKEYGGGEACDPKANNKGKSCSFDLGQLGKCGSATPSVPCLYVKVNRMYGWKPETYGPSDTLPPSMPPFLKRLHATAPDPTVYLSCRPNKDKDYKLIESFTYYPGPGFPAYYYPYLSQTGYNNPLVAIWINVPLNTPVSIYCRIWAKNVDILDETKGGFFIQYTAVS